jgi:hypothetical protein
MDVFRALRWRVVPLAVIALLMHASAPALHVHSKHRSGDGAEWTEVCTGTGGTVFVRIDPSTGEAVAATGGAPSSAQSGDHPCPQCLTLGSPAPASSGPANVAVAAADRVHQGNSAPDRLLTWSAERSRAPPSTR